MRYDDLADFVHNNLYLRHVMLKCHSITEDFGLLTRLCIGNSMISSTGVKCEGQTMIYWRVEYKVCHHTVVQVRCVLVI